MDLRCEFKQCLVLKKLSMDNPEVQRLLERAQGVVGKDGYECNLVPTTAFIREVLLRPYHKDGLVKALEGLEKAFCSLLGYGLNLLRHGDRKEYRTIKTYTGFYVCNISDHVGLFGGDVLRSMGYRYRDEREQDELVLVKLSDWIFDLTFQLFLSIAETRRFMLIARRIASQGYSDEVAGMVFDKVDCSDFKLAEVLDYCELFRRQLSRDLQNTNSLLERSVSIPAIYSSGSEPVLTRSQSGSSTPVFDDVRAGIIDRDLYGGRYRGGMKPIASRGADQSKLKVATQTNGEQYSPGPFGDKSYIARIGSFR